MTTSNSKFWAFAISLNLIGGCSSQDASSRSKPVAAGIQATGNVEKSSTNSVNGQEKRIATH